MKGIVIEKPGVVTLKDDVPKPELSPYSVIVENMACGICNGTDLKMIDGHFKGFSSYPAVLGHESIGRVVEVGEKVKTYKKGDLVLRTILEDTPRYASGWGSFAELGLAYDYTEMKAANLPNVNDYYVAQQVVPSDIDPVKGIMIITFKEVLGGLKGFGIGKGHTIMVNGCGPVGLSMVRLAKSLGVAKIIASDLDDKRLQHAGKLGADFLLNPAKDDIEREVKKAEKDGLDFFLDAVGVNGLMNSGLNLVKFGGKVCVYGISPALSAQVDWTNAPYNWTIQFIQWPNVELEATLHEEVVELVRSGYLDLNEFVTHVLPMEEFEKGIQLVKEKRALKVSLTIK